MFREHKHIMVESPQTQYTNWDVYSDFGRKEIINYSGTRLTSLSDDRSKIRSFFLLFSPLTSSIFGEYTDTVKNETANKLSTNHIRRSRFCQPACQVPPSLIQSCASSQQNIVSSIRHEIYAQATVICILFCTTKFRKSCLALLICDKIVTHQTKCP